MTQFRPLVSPPRTYPPRLPNAVRRWRSITVHLPDWLLAEFTILAKELNVSRSLLVRESLEFGGLGYAQAQARRKREEAAAQSTAAELPV
jgi:metal-responsive CopG/Arc/MetJ family transcriptional regulator